MFRIMKYLSKAEIGQMLIALVSIVGQIWFDLELPDYMSDITTLVETPGSAMADIWVAGGKMLLVSLGSVACAIITGYIAARVASSFGQRLRSLEFRKVESFGPAEMSKFSTASLITRSTNDITQIQMFITMGLQLIVKSPIMAVWAVCKIAGEGFEWTVATAIAVVILLVAVVILMALVMPKFKAMQRLTDNINLVARENLTGLRVVRAYNAEDYQESKFTKANKDLTDTQLFTNRTMAIMMPLMNTVMNGLMLAVRAARDGSVEHRADCGKRHQARGRYRQDRSDRHRGIQECELHLPGFARGHAAGHQFQSREGPDRGVHRLYRLGQVVAD